MKAEFWFHSWEKGGFCTSFHRKDIHPYATTYLRPDVIAGKNILIPLCGKTLDILYFSEYAHQVIGVELVEQAILEFFAEHQMTYTQPNSTTFVSGNITLLCRDFMSLTQDDLPQIHWIYDRAALVALPDEMRHEYLYTIDRLSNIGTQSLVITLEYYPLLDSAPFSISQDEIQQYYGAGHHLLHVEKPLLMDHGMVRRWQLNYLYEHGFLLYKHTHQVMLQEAIPIHCI